MTIRDEGRTRAWVAAASGLILLALAGCGPTDDAAPARTSGGSTPAKTTASEVKLSFSIPDGTTDVATQSVLGVFATGGTIDQVSVVSQDGKQTVVVGKTPDGSWMSRGPLMPKTTYVATVTAHGSDGQTAKATSTFTTVTPRGTMSYTVTPDGSTVGAGMPLSVNFEDPIESPEVRAEIESRLTVTSTPSQEGSWGWTSHSSLQYRPKVYWAADTKISVKAPLAGTEVAPGIYLMENNGAELTIGVQRIMKADLLTHRMALYENGALVKTFLISGGRPGWQFETRGGTKVISDKNATIIMDSSTFGINKGDPEYYRTPVQWAMRITTSGEFLHSAPWSVGQQGYANVSHGCINMAPGDASWLFDRAQIGDVVETTGSSIPLPPGDAGIAVWLYGWDQWKAKSALAGRPTPTPTHSPTTTGTATTGAPTPTATGATSTKTGA